MKQLLSEELIPLPQARKEEIPKRHGKPVSPSTIWRWIRKGLRASDGRRIRLEVTYAGRTPCTSREAIQRFFSELTEARLDREDESAGEPEGRSEATENRLREAGLL